tara:strand:+ start:64 stop:267 length:204 start_codon:yes stop_codon:yes gene_type:complete
MIYPSLFDSFFAPTRVIVVSEERLQQAEREAKENQLKSVEARINELNEYKESLSKELKALQPAEDSK